MRFVLVGQLSLVQRHGPVDGSGLVGEVEECVLALCVRRPVIVDEVRVGRIVLEGLECVAHPTRNEDGLARIKLRGEDRAERRTFTQVDPRTEYPARRY